MRKPTACVTSEETQWLQRAAFPVMAASGPEKTLQAWHWCCLQREDSIEMGRGGKGRIVEEESERKGREGGEGSEREEGSEGEVRGVRGE